MIGFNHVKFGLHCKLDSRDYDSLLDFDVMFKELFRPSEWWVNCDLIQSTTICFRAIHGWEASLERDSAIICNGYDKKKYARGYRGGGLKKGCKLKLPLVVKYNNVVVPKVMTERSRTKSCPNFTRETKLYRAQEKMFYATSTSVTASQAKKT